MGPVFRPDERVSWLKLPAHCGGACSACVGKSSLFDPKLVPDEVGDRGDLVLPAQRSVSPHVVFQKPSRRPRAKRLSRCEERGKTFLGDRDTAAPRAERISSPGQCAQARTEVDGRALAGHSSLNVSNPLLAIHAERIHNRPSPAKIHCKDLYGLKLCGDRGYDSVESIGDRRQLERLHHVASEFELAAHQGGLRPQFAPGHLGEHLIIA